MPLSEQNRIIGPHGNLKSVLKDWLLCEDIEPTDKQVIRHLDESIAHREALIKQCAWWVVMSHVGSKNWRKLKKIRQKLAPDEFTKYLQDRHYLPYSDLTRKGNLGEILLCEYIHEITNYVQHVAKLRYNPNVEQSMKGDDVLLFNPSNVHSDVIYGESKIRKVPDKDVVPEIVNNLQGDKKFPTSINFVIQILRDRGQDELADELDELLCEIANKKVPIRHVGWLISSKGTTMSSDVLQRTRNTLEIEPDANLVFVAVGIDNVQQFVDDVYGVANTILMTGKMQ